MSEAAAAIAPVAKTKRRRRPVQISAPLVTITVTWKNGKVEQHDAAGVSYAPGQIILQTITPDGWVRTIFMERDEMRKLEVLEPWRPPAQQPAERVYAGTSAAPVPAPARPESIMHVSPGMAHRKSPGRTIVTPDGQTATQTPEGDIVGAALFAAGMPAGRVGL